MYTRPLYLFIPRGVQDFEKRIEMYTIAMHAPCIYSVSYTHLTLPTIYSV